MGRIRKGVRLDQMTTRLDLPEDAYFGRCLIVLVFEVDKVETSGLAVERLDGETTPRRLRTVASIPARGTAMGSGVGEDKVTKPRVPTVVSGS